MKQERNGMLGTNWQVADCSEVFPWLSKESAAKSQEVRQWLASFDGKGRYFYDELFDQVYFECDEDRTMFMLRWS